MATAAGRFRSARLLYGALRVSSQPCALGAVVSKPRPRFYVHATRQMASSATQPPPVSEPDTATVSDTAAAEAAERGLRILRGRSRALEQDDAVEALRLLLRAASAESVPRDVHFALGELHYTWGELLEFGKRAELGGEGAARAVVAEIKELRKQAMRKRQLAPASSGEKGYPKARPARGVGVVEDKERTPTKDAAAVGVTAGGGGNDASAVEADHPEAWEWYLKAAACGDTRAMMQLGDIAMESSAKTAANLQHAEEWYRKAAAGDPPQPSAIFQIARKYHEGIGVPSDPARARELYDEAHDAGSPAAAYFLGHRFHVGDQDLGIEADGARALHLLRQASEQGHAEATFYLAQAYRSGSPEMGLPQDLRVFGELLQQAASAGSSDALFALGGAFFHGEDGFARDPRAAFRYYASAADDGEHADASYCLGVMHYAMGDLQEAFRRYQTAAEGGNMLAWRNLASMYALGEGVPRSEQMAKSILQTFGERIERQEREEKGEEDQDKPR